MIGQQTYNGACSVEARASRRSSVSSIDAIASLLIAFALSIIASASLLIPTCALLLFSQMSLISVRPCLYPLESNILNCKRAFPEGNHVETGWDDCMFWVLQVRDQNAGRRRFGKQQKQQHQSEHIHEYTREVKKQNKAMTRQQTYSSD